MKEYFFEGESLKAKAKSIVISFMTKQPECKACSDGLKQAEIFRACGFDWGDKPSAPSSNQQYWLVALLRELEADGYIERVHESGPWRLK